MMAYILFMSMTLCLLHEGFCAIIGSKGNLGKFSFILLAFLTPHSISLTSMFL